MKLLNIAGLMLAIGLSQAVSAKPKVEIGIGGGGASICIGRNCDRFDRDGRRGRGDGWDRRHRPTTCYARNARGIRFQSTGFGPEFQIQRSAVRECRFSRQTRNPATCRPLGCRNGRF